MDQADREEMLSLAERLADEAGGIAFDMARQGRTSRKADGSVVTEADRAVQAHIVRAIRSAFPDHAIVAEESMDPADTGDPRTARYCWVIDPLDGTRNYVAGFPCVVTSIAVLEAGRPVVGVAVEHHLKDRYAAIGGGGLRHNGEEVEIGEPPPGHDILIGCPSSKDALTVRVLRNWLGTRGLIYRNTGSSVAHLGMTATGVLGAAFAKQCKIWDVAAGYLFVTEAGGLVTDPAGHDLAPFDLGADPGEDVPFLAGAPRVHARLLAMIQADTA